MRVLLAFAVFLLFTSVAWSGTMVKLFSLQGLSYEEELFVLALEGRLNSSGPRLYLDTSQINWPGRDADALWQAWYEERKGYQFERVDSLQQLVALFMDDIESLAVYDDSLDALKYLAFNEAPDGALPVSADLLESSLALFEDIAIERDFRERFSSEQEAWEWAIENQLPKRSQREIYSVGRSYPGLQIGGDPSVQLCLDWAIKHNLFVFNLPFDTKPFAPNNATPPEGDYSSLVALTDRVLEGLEKPAAVWGWAEPEYHFARKCSSHNCYVLCGAGPNLSFHEQVPLDGPLPPLPKPPVPPLEPKVYVTFLTNEGDTPKAIVSEYRCAWRDSERGSVPITWLMNPLLLDRFPALWEYYLTERKGDDIFAVACSGAGYTILSAMPNVQSYAAHTQSYLEKTGLEYVDVWTDGYDPKSWKAYQEAVGAKGLSVQAWMPDELQAFPDGTVLTGTAPGLIYWRVPEGRYAAEWMAEQLRDRASKRGRPAFLQVYCGTSATVFRKTMELLGSEYVALPYNAYNELASEFCKLQAPSGRFWTGPGESRPFELVARNYGESELKSLVSLAAPSEWVLEPSSVTFEIGPKEEKTLLFSLKVPEDAKPGKYEVTINSDYAGSRSLIATVFSRLMSLSLNLQDWSPWPGIAATGSQAGPDLVIHNAPGKPYSAFEVPFEADFSSNPQLLIEVPQLKGAWAVKLRAEEAMKDWVVIQDTNLAGTHVVPLNVPGWEGLKKARLIVFSLGEGSEVEIGRAALVWE